MINLLSNDVWTEADIVAYGRAVIASRVTEARQNELRTIMLGHIAQMRVASPEELAEIALVQQITEAQVLANDKARNDNNLLKEVILYEADKTLEVSAEVLNLYNLRNLKINKEAEDYALTDSSEASNTSAN